MDSLEKQFGKNVRRLRIKAAMTQAALGEKLGYSEKSISKWERGDCIPSAHTLLELARFFHVKLDELLRDEQRYFLGIDGGGTKTELVLADEEGNALRRLLVGPGNPVDIGLGAVKELLRNAIYEICEGISLSSVFVFAGLAGAIAANMHAPLTEFFEGFGFAGASVDSDSRNIIGAGLGTRDGIIMILGTGISVFTQKNGVLTRYGGWGYYFDEGGSAFHLGREALSVHFQGLDGTAEKTVLSSLIAKDHPDTATLLGRMYAEGKRTIASFAKYVYQAIEQDDPTAKNILQRNMTCAATLLKTAAKDFAAEAAPIPVILGGGLTAQPKTLSYFRQALGPNPSLQLQVLQVPPVTGALRLAADLANKKGDHR